MESKKTDELVHIVKWHNGSKDWSPFSDAEMSRRQNDLRGYMAKNNIDIAWLAGGSSAGVPIVYKTINGGGSWQSVLLTTNSL